MPSRLLTVLWGRYIRAFLPSEYSKPLNKRLRIKLADEVRTTDHKHHPNSFCCTPHGLALRFDPRRLP